MTLPERIAITLAYLVVGSALGCAIAVVAIGIYIGAIQ